VSGAGVAAAVQVSVLGTPSPSVTPTNLVYNVVATPGALLRYWRPFDAIALVLVPLGSWLLVRGGELRKARRSTAVPFHG
jgi:hypothetical protein